MTRTKLNDDQLRELLATYQTDEPVASIAERFGIKVDAVVTCAKKAKVRRPAGLKSPRSKWKLTDEQKRDMLTAYGHGEPIEEIAEKFGIPVRMVATHASDAGVRRPQREASSS
jgi:hypothetical protein